MKLKISLENCKRKTERITCIAADATAEASAVVNNDNAFKVLPNMFLFYYSIFNFRLVIISSIPKKRKEELYRKIISKLKDLFFWFSYQTRYWSRFLSRESQGLHTCKILSKWKILNILGMILCVLILYNSILAFLKRKKKLFSFSDFHFHFVILHSW